MLVAACQQAGLLPHKRTLYQRVLHVWSIPPTQHLVIQSRTCYDVYFLAQADWGEGAFKLMMCNIKRHINKSKHHPFNIGWLSLHQ